MILLIHALEDFMKSSLKDVPHIFHNEFLETVKQNHSSIVQKYKEILKIQSQMPSTLKVFVDKFVHNKGDLSSESFNIGKSPTLVNPLLSFLYYSTSFLVHAWYMTNSNLKTFYQKQNGKRKISVEGCSGSTWHSNFRISFCTKHETWWMVE